MKLTRLRVLLLVLLATAGACQTANSRSAQNASPVNVPSSSPADHAIPNDMPVVHVFVALADNEHQGIVPVSAALGNGDSTKTNLYWGAAFGVKAFLSKSKDWELVADTMNPSPVILERCVFKNRTQNVYLIADAYRGREIGQAAWDFLAAAAGRPGSAIEVKQDKRDVTIHSGGSADLLVYVGHDVLMDLKLPPTPKALDKRRRQTIILACASKQYFTKVLEPTGALPLLWTTNLMAPEAYILSAALDGWMKHETDEQIRVRAAAAYNKYQHCGVKSANNLFATGW
jgi:hypothetical protein